MNSNDDSSQVEPADDELAQLPAERLAQMLREKRRSEGNYRTQLRDAEAERDRLSEAVTGYQRASFGEFARGRRVLESAVDDAAERVDLADLLGEDGRLDEEKAAAALDDLQQSRPYLFEQPASRSAADFTGQQGERIGETASWGDVLSQ